MKKKRKILQLSKETIASLDLWSGAEPGGSTLTPCTSICTTCIDVSQQVDCLAGG